MDIINEKYSHICRICSEDQENGVFIFGDEGKDLYLQAKIRKYLCITVQYNNYSIDKQFYLFCNLFTKHVRFGLCCLDISG